MTEENARKRMAKLGEVHQDGHELWVEVGEQRLSCCIQAGHTISFHTQLATEEADLLTDHFPGNYWDSFKQAVKYGLGKGEI